MGLGFAPHLCDLDFASHITTEGFFVCLVGFCFACFVFVLFCFGFFFILFFYFLGLVGFVLFY